MISEHEARAVVLGRCARLSVVTMAVSDAMGLVLAHSVVAGEDVPPFANSAVDGYAVRASDTADPPVDLQVVAEVPAGSATDVPVGTGEAVRIMTGAPMPTGADAAVMVEDTERLDDGAVVRVLASVAPGSAVRSVGDDIRNGTLLYPAGVEVRPAVAAVLRSVNVNRVDVVGRPIVAVLCTGDELVGDGSPLQPGQIRESNTTMIRALVQQVGCDVVDLGIVPDDEALLTRVLTDAAERCDAIVTTGGVSMGDYDVVKAVLGRIADMRWMQIAIKPAKPFAFGTISTVAGRAIPVFGLPGNPVSSMVSFELFARPALRQMMGHTVLDRPGVLAIADEGLPRRPDGRVHYVRVSGRFADDGRYHIASVGAQGSHQLAASSLADALAVVPDGHGIDPGDPVLVWLLSVG
jgi:molybdenum cofactor synthesis domain-containing protein